MTYPNTEGDGALDLPVLPNEKEGTIVSIDISPNVANQLLSETVGNIQSTNSANRDSAALAQAHLRYALAKNFDEVGTLEGRAVSGVNASPLASPVVPQSSNG